MKQLLLTFFLIPFWGLAQQPPAWVDDAVKTSLYFSETMEAYSCKACNLSGHIVLNDLGTTHIPYEDRKQHQNIRINDYARWDKDVTLDKTQTHNLFLELAKMNTHKAYYRELHKKAGNSKVLPELRKYVYETEMDIHRKYNIAHSQNIYDLTGGKSLPAPALKCDRDSKTLQEIHNEIDNWFEQLNEEKMTNLFDNGSLLFKAWTQSNNAKERGPIKGGLFLLTTTDILFPQLDVAESIENGSDNFSGSDAGGNGYLAFLDQLQINANEYGYKFENVEVFLSDHINKLRLFNLNSIKMRKFESIFKYMVDNGILGALRDGSLLVDDSQEWRMDGSIKVNKPPNERSCNNNFDWWTYEIINGQQETLYDFINKMLNLDFGAVQNFPSLRGINQTVLGCMERQRKIEQEEASLEKIETVFDQYEFVGFFNDGIAVSTLNNKYGWIDEQGKVVIPHKYERVETHYFDEENGYLVGVKLNGKYGVIDKTGKVVIPFEYSNIGEFYHGFVGAEKKGKWGVIDKNNKVIVPFKYDDAYSNDLYDDVQLWVMKEDKESDKWGVFDANGKALLPVKYDEIGVFSDDEGLAVVQKGKLFGFVNDKWEIVVPVKYQDALDFQEGLAAVARNDKWGFVDKLGQEVIPTQYDVVSGGFYYSSLSSQYGRYGRGRDRNAGGSFYEGLARVDKNGKIGFINKKGEVVIPLKYDDALDFKDGIVAVAVGDKFGKFGFIDKTGKETVPLKYPLGLDKDGYYYDNVKKEHVSDGTTISLAEEFGYGKPFAIVSLSGDDTNYGMLNRKGEIVIPFECSFIKYGDKMIRVQKGNKHNEATYRWGYFNYEGEQVTPIIYQRASRFGDVEKGVAYVKKDEKWYYINMKGECIRNCY